MARVVKGKGAAVRDGVLRRAAVDSKPKDSVAAEDLEVGRITSAHGQHFEVEMSNGQTAPFTRHLTLSSTNCGCHPKSLTHFTPPKLIRHRHRDFAWSRRTARFARLLTRTTHLSPFS
ncbi:MAG: hypothetical protein SGPRY_011151 [Prymnesium sp.]